MRDVHIDTGQQIASSMPSPLPGEAIFLTTTELTPQTLSQHASTLTTDDAVSTSTRLAVEGLDDFYDQSLGLHENLIPSQLSVLQSQDASPSESYRSGEITQVSPSSSVAHVPIFVPFSLSFQHLTDVKNIPSAAYLQSIEPQTMTVNLIVGIMALPLPRSVTVGRRWGREQEMQLLAMLVGDDTRSGFEITMWLSNNMPLDEGLAHRSILESQIQGLRQGDIVLLRNVALSTYQGRVHGQSLRKDVTKVDLLYRKRLDSADADGMYPAEVFFKSTGHDLVMAKTKRVKRWLINFVNDGMPDNFGEAATKRGIVLPPDTQ